MMNVFTKMLPVARLILSFGMALTGTCLICPVLLNGQSWRPATAPLMTPWASEVDPQNTLPEYPRPMMVRPDWVNLNGLWEFEPVAAGEALPAGRPLKEQILVPFPWESALSGIRRQLPGKKAWYKRVFEVPAAWKDQTVLLHFGAVDYEATVYVNSFCAGVHKGGYDAFYFDISPYLKKTGANELLVQVYDPSNTAAIAYGKQNEQRFDDPQRYAYTPASGIWQTVWLEPVPKKGHITDFQLVPDIDRGAVMLTVDAAVSGGKYAVHAVILEAGVEKNTGEGSLFEPFEIPLPDARLWSPEDPFLYDVSIQLRDTSGKVRDEVKGYFGMRKISLLKKNGVPRLALNNQYLYQFGPLDQGYWPDGIYTAPTDEALRWDIAETKSWGFNMIRKHIKVEPQRWYYWCDKLGILVWQDMPGTFGKRNGQEKIQFETELQQMVKQHWNHPSIINWVVFNEHWGIYDVERLTPFVKALDPSRLVTGNSGIDAGRPSIDFEIGDIKDNHSYRPPSVSLISDRRATVNGEYGAVGYVYEGHVWDQDGPWVHFNFENKEKATTEYLRFIEMITKDFQQKGSSAAVYTQWTDVENEMNGIYTYDRKQEKLDRAKVTAANRSTWNLDRGISVKE